MTTYTLRSAHIFVRDLPAARSFYLDTLGVPLAFEGPGYLGLDTGECGLMVFATASKPDSVDTCLHLGVSDIRATHAALVSKGVCFRRAPWSEPWGGVLAEFFDNDGNVLCLVQYPGQ